jgi:hypothetical protein
MFCLFRVALLSAPVGGVLAWGWLEQKRVLAESSKQKNVCEGGFVSVIPLAFRDLRSIDVGLSLMVKNWLWMCLPVLRLYLMPF